MNIEKSGKTGNKCIVEFIMAKCPKCGNSFRTNAPTSRLQKTGHYICSQCNYKFEINNPNYNK